MIASILLAALSVIYSADGVNAGSGIRECPSQGVSKTTGKVVIGLHSLSDVERMDCGYWRYVNIPKPDTTHYWKSTNYCFTATGTVWKIWSEYTPKPRALNYSKLAIIMKLEQMNGGNGYVNKWELVKAKIEEYGYTDKWNAATYITSDNADFIAAKPLIANLLGMTVKELDDWLATCKY